MTAREKNIVGYSLKRKPKRGRTDLKRVLATTNAEIERDAAGDPDVALPRGAGWFADARVVFPIAKMPISIRIDADILEFFRRSGPGWQTRMNDVLRVFMARALSARKLRSLKQRA
jgi:uncharacterized protein (DUF4415 family)